MKKIISAVAALVLVFGSAASLAQGAFTESTSITVSAQGTENSGKCGENVAWTFSDGTLTISGSGAMTDYEYGDSPFTERTDIQSVVIRSGVTSIGRFSFMGTSLTSVEIPAGVETIGNNAFKECSKLTSLTLPDTLKTIGESAFSDCSGLSSITIPDSVTSIGDNAFSYCSGITGADLPSGIKHINYGVFSGCTNLRSITIPDGVTAIGDWAFYSCDNLETINIPSSVTMIGNQSFDSTVWLDNQRAKNVMVIVNDILVDARKCSGKVKIPSGVKSVASGAFSWCKDITSVTIAQGVTSIGEVAFDGCENLADVTIPGSVTEIGGNAFYGTKWLEQQKKNNPLVIVNDILIDAQSCTGEVTIPSGVKTIGGYAFDENSGITVTIPRSVTHIAPKAFNYCENLKIRGVEGSAAETYAKANNIPFEIIVITTRLAGKSRYETAAEISKASFDKADTVVLAYSMNYADALAGVPLAYQKNAPILLTDTKALDAATLAEIKRLEAKNVIILGGEGAVGKEVEDALIKEKISIQRIAGKNRFATAAAIAEETNKELADVFFVYGLNYADALSVSTVAAIKNAPVIYLTTKGRLNADTAAYLAKIKGKVKNAYVIGGDGVISNDMMNKAAKALGLKKAARVAGKDRFKTCTAVNNTFRDVLTGDKLCIATGMDFPDALAGGVYAAKNNAPLLLINGSAKKPSLNDEQKAYLKAKKPGTFAVFGGTGVVPDSHVEDIVNNS